MKETLPKKPDGQSGVPGGGGFGLGRPLTRPGSRRAALLGLIGESHTPLSGPIGFPFCAFLPLPHRPQLKACLVSKCLASGTEGQCVLGLCWVLALLDLVAGGGGGRGAGEAVRDQEPILLGISQHRILTFPSSLSFPSAG